MCYFYFLFYYCFFFFLYFVFFFFFQAEDGIRDPLVTGVQRVLFRSRGPGAGSARGTGARAAAAPRAAHSLAGPGGPPGPAPARGAGRRPAAAHPPVADRKSVV